MAFDQDITNNDQLNKFSYRLRDNSTAHSCKFPIKMFEAMAKEAIKECLKMGKEPTNKLFTYIAASMHRNFEKLL